MLGYEEEGSPKGALRRVTDSAPCALSVRYIVNCKGPALCTLQAAPGKPIMADQILNCRFHEIKARPTFRCTLNPLLMHSAVGGAIVAPVVALARDGRRH